MCHGSHSLHDAHRPPTKLASDQCHTALPAVHSLIHKPLQNRNLLIYLSYCFSVRFTIMQYKLYDIHARQVTSLRSRQIFWSAPQNFFLDIGSQMTIFVIIHLAKTVLVSRNISRIFSLRHFAPPPRLLPPRPSRYASRDIVCNSLNN